MEPIAEFPSGETARDLTVARIEAALLAALNGGRELAGERVRAALLSEGLGSHVEAWLESAAAELRTNSAVRMPDDMVEAISRQITSDRRRSINAHSNVDCSTLRNLIRRP